MKYEKAVISAAADASRCIIFGLFVVLITSTACGPNRRIINSAATPEPAAGAEPVQQLSPLERDLQAMRNADFNFIYVFRRKDRGVFDADDKAFLNAVTPAEINRRRLSDGDKAVIMGSNFKMPPENLTTITDRFDLEDHSKPENAIINSNQNTNSNK